MSVSHDSLSGDNLHVPFHYEDDNDPGAVGAGKYWLDTDSGPPLLLYRRNIGDTDWDLVGGSGGGGEIDYAEVTAGATITATSAATANAFITGNPVAYDGSTRVKIEFYIARLEISPGDEARVELYEGSSDIGKITEMGPFGFTVSGSRILTPAAGTKTYSIRIWKSGGTCDAYATSGGAGSHMPAYMRITPA